MQTRKSCLSPREMHCELLCHALFNAIWGYLFISLKICHGCLVFTFVLLVLLLLKFWHFESSNPQLLHYYLLCRGCNSKYQTCAIVKIIYILGAQLTQMPFCSYQESMTSIEPAWRRPMKPWLCISCLSFHFE